VSGHVRNAVLTSLLLPCFCACGSSFSVCLGGRVKRICWRWRGASDAAAVSAAAASDLDLAVCGEDQSVRIFAVPAAFLGLADLASTRS